jgi:hypothetical protein
MGSLKLPRWRLANSCSFDSKNSQPALSALSDTKPGRGLTLDDLAADVNLHLKL